MAAKDADDALTVKLSYAQTSYAIIWCCACVMVRVVCWFASSASAVR